MVLLSVWAVSIFYIIDTTTAIPLHSFLFLYCATALINLARLRTKSKALRRYILHTNKMTANETTNQLSMLTIIIYLPIHAYSFK